MSVVAGIDLGGTAVNYTFVDNEERWLIDGLCEHPARSKEGPGHLPAADCGRPRHRGRESRRRPRGRRVRRPRHARAGEQRRRPERARLDQLRPSRHGPASTSARRLAHKLGKPVTYLNDGNAGALWGHFAIFGASKPATSISAIVGTGLGGGVIVDGNVVKGRSGFGGELGHVLDPLPEHRAHRGARAGMQLRPHRRSRVGLLADRDRQDRCCPTSWTATRITSWRSDRPHARRQARARAGGARRRDVPRHLPRAGARARALLRRDDQHVRSGRADRRRRRDRDRRGVPTWFVDEIRAGMPAQRKEQADIPIHIMPNGDTAGARGAAIEALKLARDGGLI